MKKKSRILIIILMSLFFFSCSPKIEMEYGTDILDLKTIAEKEIQENEREISQQKQEERQKELRELEFETTLLSVGDVMFHSPQLDAARQPDGSYTFMDSFRYLRPILEKGYAIANFESTIAEKGFMGYPAFKTPASSMNALRFAGFEMLALANNHTLDGGVPGIIRTNTTAKNFGFDVVGTYLDENTEPKIVNINGRDIAFLNYTYGLNGLDRYIEGKEYMVNRIQEEKILKDIKYAKENAKGTVVIVHWGTEYKRTPDDYQKKWAKFFVEHGVDIILGSHPHVIEPAEFIEHEGHKTYCIYSQGNFISNQRREYMGGSPYGEDGVIVELKIKSKDDRIYVSDVDYHPTWVHRGKDPLSFTIYPCEMVLNGEIEVDEFIKNRVKESVERTMESLGVQNADN